MPLGNYDKKGGDFDTSVPDIKEAMFRELASFMLWNGYESVNVRHLETSFDFDKNEFVLRVKLLPRLQINKNQEET